MDQYFKIFRITAADAAKIASSPNEPHIHEFEELLIGAEGQIEHFIDFEAVSYKAPFVSFIAKGKVHRIKPMSLGNKCNIWAICFSSDFIPESTFQLYAYYHDRANIEIRDDRNFSRMLMIAEMINEEMMCENPKMVVVRDLLKTLFTMVEAEDEKKVLKGADFPKTQNTAFKNFLKILEDNFRRPVGVSFYAEKLFMSTRNLNLICRNVMNKSVSEIIETRKLTEAKNLLTYTDKNIAEIGFELGFNEKSYFTNVFKKTEGKTPSEFRDEIRRHIS